MKKPIPFGKYYLLERINVGGMAEVFKAKAYGVEGFERLVAVKRILPNIAEDEEFITMFIDEAKIAVQLNHANIAQIFDLGKVDDSYFIALEYIHGRDLRTIFDRCRSLGDPMPIAQACFIIMKLCEGLDYAHNKRDPSGRELHLVHRDVSPQNVLISIEGEVKVIDFGIAKAAGKASKTQAGILKGKFGYMSPEQVRGLPIDRRSDVFSVGIVLYELLTGERLFVGESDFSTLEKVRNVEILPPSTYNRKIPEELERIVLKTLAKDVDERYQNSIDLHDELQAFMYSSGEFYARKDLASWMKKTFAKEIDEESRKLEAQRKMLTPDAAAASSPSLRRSSQSMPALPLQSGVPQPVAPRATLRGVGATPPPPPPPGAMSAAPAAAPPWTDDELQTAIYDRPPDAPDEAPPAATLPLDMRPAKMMPITPAGSGDGVGAAGSEPPSSASWDSAPPVMPHLQMPETEDFGLGLAISGQGPTEVLPTVPAARRTARKSSSMPVALGVAIALVVASAGAAYYFLVFARRPATLFLAANPVDATVVLDDEQQSGSTPMTLRLRPGAHVVEVSKLGYLPFAQTIEAKAGQRLERIVQLEVLGLAGTPKALAPPPTAAARADAGLPPPVAASIKARFASTPAGAKVYLTCDGKRTYQGTTPLDSKLDPAKQCSASLELAGHRPYTEELRADGRRELVVMAALEKLEPAPVEPRVKPPVAVAKAPREPRVPKEPRAPKEPRTPREPKGDRTPPLPKIVSPDVKPPPVAAKMGYLRINSKPWTRILIDGRDTGLTTPQTKISLPAGRHSVTLVNNPFNIKHSFSITIQSGETSTKVLDLRNPEQHND